MDDNWTAHPVQFQWDNGVCLKPCGDEENIVKNALRHSRTMTFNDLLTVAHVKGLERPQRFSRKDLLTHLSQLFGSEPFIEELGSDAKIAKGNDDNLGLMGCIFENMDKSEQKDFDGIETKLRKSKDQEIKKRWADWTAEKKAEVKASHFHCVLLTSKLAVTEINCNNCQCLTVWLSWPGRPKRKSALPTSLLVAKGVAVAVAVGVDELVEKVGGRGKGRGKGGCPAADEDEDEDAGDEGGEGENQLDSADPIVELENERASSSALEMVVAELEQPLAEVSLNTLSAAEASEQVVAESQLPVQLEEAKEEVEEDLQTESLLRFSRSIDDFNVESPTGPIESIGGASHPDLADQAQGSSSVSVVPAEALAPLAESAGSAGPSKPRASAAGIVKVNKTPAQILKPLEPHESFRVFVNYNDWRFSCQCKTKSGKFLPPYDKVNFSKSFAKDRNSWKQAIREVHKYMWEKFNLIKDELPPPPQVQAPGEVPASVLEELESQVIDKLEQPKKYQKL